MGLSIVWSEAAAVDITWDLLTQLTEFNELVENVAANAVAITTHDHDNEYKNINWLPSWSDIQGKPELALADHNHDSQYLLTDYQPVWTDLPATVNVPFAYSREQTFNKTISIENGFPILKLVDIGRPNESIYVTTTSGSPAFMRRVASGSNVDLTNIFMVNISSEKVIAFDKELSTVGHQHNWSDINGEPNFALATHNHDSNYKNINWLPTWGDVTGKPSVSVVGHTHDWDALPLVNTSKQFEHNFTQTFKGGIAINIESNRPRIRFIETDTNQIYEFLSSDGIFYITANVDGGTGWASPHPLFIRKSDESFRIFSHEAWHAGNFNPSEYWRKDELLKFNKRYYVAANATVSFLTVDFSNTSGVAAYHFDFFSWGGTLNNYSSLNRLSGWFLIEDQNVQAEPATLLETVYATFSGTSVTLKYDLNGGRNNLVIKGECCWGFNWSGHSVL